MKNSMQKRDLEILNKVTIAVQESFDLQYIYDTALDLIIELKDVDMAFIYLISEDRKKAVLQAQRNLTENYLSKASVIPYPKGVTWKLLNSGEVFNLSDIQKDKDIGPAGKEMGHRRGLGIPIILEGVVWGVIWLASYKTGEFSDREIQLNVAIGKSIGIAIAKAKLYEELKQEIKSRTAELENMNQILNVEIQNRKQVETEIRMLREQHKLANIINTALKGNKKLPPELMESLGKKLKQSAGSEKPLHEKLSKREYNVMLMIASGMSIKDIAKETFLSASTVSSYRGRILDKLSLKSTADLIRYAIKNNLLD